MITAVLGNQAPIVGVLLMTPPHAFDDPANAPILARATEVAQRKGYSEIEQLLVDHTTYITSALVHS
jgi:hypothetical protein